MNKKILSSISLFLMAMMLSLFNLVTVSAYNTGDDYPSKYKNLAVDACVDEWNFYNRECTSFVAWCLNSRNGVNFTNQYLGASRWGHAKNWGTVAASKGVTVNSVPAVGSVAWWDTGTYGHVAWVSNVNGNNVTIEEYNWSTYGGFGTRTINKSSVTGYIHIKDINSNVTKIPETPSIKNVSEAGNDITVSWNSVEQAEKYVVDYWNPTTGVHNYFSTTSTNMTQTFENGEYGIRVCAENSLGASSFSYFTYITVDAKIPDVPTIKEVNVEGSNVTAVWTTVEQAEKYIVDYWNANTGVHNYFTLTGTNSTQSLPDGLYGVRISAENSLGNSGFSYFTYVQVLNIDVYTDDFSAVSATTMRVNGKYYNPNRITVLKNGFYYGTDPDELKCAGIDRNESYLNGGIYYDLINLVPGETYYYQAFVSNGVVEKRGSIKSFTVDNIETDDNVEDNKDNEDVEDNEKGENENSSYIEVGTVTGRAGQSVTLPIIIENNPGIAGMQLKLLYDESLTLAGIEKGEALSNLTFTVPGDLSENPLTLPWDGLDADSTNGEILLISFTIADDASEGEYDIAVSYESGNIYDDNLENVDFAIKNGSITVKNFIPGDINGDNEITTKDVTILRRYIARGYELTVIDNALDVNKDGSVTTKDVTVLRRYIAGGYGVVLE